MAGVAVIIDHLLIDVPTAVDLVPLAPLQNMLLALGNADAIATGRITVVGNNSQLYVCINERLDNGVPTLFPVYANDPDGYVVNVATAVDGEDPYQTYLFVAAVTLP